MGKKTVEKMSKHLAWLLRHDKQAFQDGIIDKDGWRIISELIKEHGYSYELLDEIVKTNDKKRYEYNEGKSCIRARQGHSIPVDVGLTEAEPPKVLYHGTYTHVSKSIYRSGILKGRRLYVHLSKDRETALKVGSRHGTPFVLEIDAEQMYKDGVKFYISNNGVWMTEYVDSKYLHDKNE